MAAKKVKNLTKEVLEEFKKIPGGDKIKECIQCGTCSASCPAVSGMDYAPRQVIAKLRANEIEDVLKSNTAWVCASCYSCTVRCPAGIKFTDFMYQLKRAGIEFGILPKNKNGIRLAKSFGNTVKKYGRNFEPELIIRYNITNPFNFLKVAPLGIKLFTHNRMPILPSKVKGAKHIKKALAAAHNGGAK
jgi:heterodisulfide reductase subunit C